MSGPKFDPVFQLEQIDGLTALSGRSVNLATIPRMLGDQPRYIEELWLRCTVVVVVPNAGAAITGASFFALISNILFTLGSRIIVNMSARQLRMLQIVEEGALRHSDPADAAINGTRTFTFWVPVPFIDYRMGPGAHDDGAILAKIVSDIGQLRIQTAAITAVTSKANTSISTFSIAPYLVCSAKRNERLPLTRVRDVYAQGTQTEFTLPPGIYRSITMFSDDTAPADTGIADADLSTVTNVDVYYDGIRDVANLPGARTPTVAGVPGLAEIENTQRVLAALAGVAGSTQGVAEVSETAPDRLVFSYMQPLRTALGNLRRAEQAVRCTVVGGTRPRTMLLDRYVPRDAQLRGDLYRALEYSNKRIVEQVRSNRKAVSPNSINSVILPVNLLGEDSYYNHLREKTVQQMARNPQFKQVGSKIFSQSFMSR